MASPLVSLKIADATGFIEIENAALSVGTFRCHSMSTAKPLISVFWDPCFGYPEDNFFFNPFYRWRFTEQ